METIILAAGQGTRLRPLTDNCPKCMVEINGQSIIERQLAVMNICGIRDEEITIVCGYRNDILQDKLKDRKVKFIVNKEFESTNMVYSLMCARKVLEVNEDILISYGDIIYNEEVLNKILNCTDNSAVIVDDGWYGYWSARCDNPLDDAETLIFDSQDYLTEIGQKTRNLSKIQSQYIGLMRFKEDGLKAVLNISAEAERRSRQGEKLWRTDRTYEKMYMTDLLQGIIDEGGKLKAIHIQRGWFEIDDIHDLKLTEAQLS